MKKWYVLILAALLWLPNAQAQLTSPTQANPFAQDNEFLPVEQAFKFSFEQRGNKLTLSWDIAPGYYLYRKQFKTVVKDAQVNEPSMPPATPHEDEFFGVTEVYYHQVSLDYDIEESAQDGMVKIQYQGCASAGLCYPPTVKVVYLDAVGSTPNDGIATSDGSQTAAPVESEQFQLARLLENDLGIALLTLLGLGLLLAFTPCVFPMFPIVSAIVLGGKKQVSTGQAFTLSFVYVQGMAVTYSILGLVVASVGVQFQAALQHPVILVTFIALFLVLAAAMFGLWELQLPSRWQEKLNSVSNQQKGGNLIGVFFMGAISGLVASPCTTAPLTAILLVVAQSGDLLNGFAALYALSIGMGIPLILFAMTGGKLLPKAGAWMNTIKALFGFMMLAVALFFVERMWISVWTEVLWATLGLAMFGYLSTVNQHTQFSFAKGVRTTFIFVGMFAATLYGYQHLQQGLGLQSSLSSADSATPSAAHPSFIKVRDLNDFEMKLAEANRQGKSVMVDLYADWCVACKEFEAYTFPDQRVQQALSNTVWMQIDLTDNTPTNLAFQQHFDILGLPTILFFDAEGRELQSGRVTGFMGAADFADHVERLLD